MKIMSHLQKKKVFRIIQKRKHDGTIKSGVVSDTLAPDGTIKSSDVSDTLPLGCNLGTEEH